MDELALTALFARYRDYRDADALARVFDALAPGLLKVARHLTPDRALAEDLLQTTFLTAMEKASSFDDRRTIRPWLAGILVHHARHQQRKLARKPDGRRLTPRPVYDPSAVAEGRELEEEVDRALDSLPEKYKKVLLPRLIQGKRGPEIARDLGSSPGVVRMQIHRGLGLLRSLLPHSLLAALAGFFWSRSALANVRTQVLAKAVASPGTGSLVSALTFGGLIMYKKTLLITLCAAVVIGVSVRILWTDDSDTEGFEGNAQSARLVTDVDLSATTDPEETEEAVVGRTPLHAGGVEEPAVAKGTLCTGRVLDAHAIPVAGVTIFFRVESIDQVISDGAGRFEYRSTTPGTIPGVAAPYALIRSGRDAEGDGFLLVVARCVDPAGTVVDDDGRPLEGVSIEPRAGRLLDFPVVIDRTDPFRHPSALTNDAGLFAFKGLPAGFATLRLEKKGFEPLIHHVGQESGPEEHFVLHRLEEGMHVLSGIVLDHEGGIVPEALVGFGPNRTHTDRWGEFRLEFHADKISEGGVDLFAAKPGFETRVIAGFGAQAEDLDNPCLEIRFAGPALTITGRLLDGEGNPLCGSGISLWKEEFLSDFSSAEGFAVADEEVQPGDIVGRRAVAKTDEDGKFTLRGLADRCYRLRILDFEKGFAMTSGPVRAGARNVEIRIPPDAFIEKLTGVVVTRQGEPVAGAEVLATVQTVDNSSCNSWYRIKVATTAGDGSFEMTHVCRLDQVHFLVTGDDILPHSVEPEGEPSPSGNRFVVDRRCHFRVELSDPSLADRFHILDDRGERLATWRFTHYGRGSGYQYHRSLNEGKTEVITASDRACFLVLVGENKTRLPIRLVPGEVIVVRH
jgi:RNA polymerase sigma factor (sigma-70 family)